MFRFDLHWQGRLQWRHILVAAGAVVAILHAFGLSVHLPW
jgi:hypothetical protein